MVAEKGHRLRVQFPDRGAVTRAGLEWHLRGLLMHMHSKNPYIEMEASSQKRKCKMVYKENKLCLFKLNGAPIYSVSQSVLRIKVERRHGHWGITCFL